MERYICKKDYYIGTEKFASQGDYIVVMPDKVNVVNISKRQKTVKNPYIIRNTEYFYPTEQEFPFVEESSTDNVNHPKHYTSHPSGIECISITRHHDFCIGNAIKYLWRAGLKQESDMSSTEKEIEDLKKAVFYIEDKIKQLSNGNKDNIEE